MSVVHAPRWGVMTALGATLVMALATTASRGETGGRLVGNIVDENLKPLAGVLVTVSGRGAVGIYRVHTDESGDYSVPGLPMYEALTVNAIAEGKIPKTYVGIWVREGGDTWRSFRLRPPEHHETLVILDRRIPSHVLALEGAKKTLPGTAVELAIQGESRQDESQVREEMMHQPNAVLALGRTAALLARRECRQTPVVFALVPDPEGDNLPSSTMCGVALNSGLDAQLDRLVSLDPGARTLVTLFDPRRQAVSIPELEQLARERGLALTARPVRSLKDVDRMIAALSADPADAFILLSDPEFFDAQKLDRIRQFVQTHDMTYIVPDSSLLDAGGSFTDAPGFGAMGGRAGTLIGEIYRGLPPMQVGVVPPEVRTFAKRSDAPAP